jgi:histidine utilization repressor
MSRQKRPQTLYRRIHADLEKKIRSGEWAAGVRIPVEYALMAQYGCARATVNKAVSALAAAGLIERHRRAGSFVAQPRIQSAVVEIPDIQAQIARQGGQYAFRLLMRRNRTAAARRPEELALAQGDRLLELRALHVVNHRPFALEERLISLAVVPEASEEDFRATPPGTWLLQHPLLSLAWTEAEHHIRAVNVGVQTAGLLEIAPETACLAVERRTWRGDEQITYVQTIFRGDAYNLTARFKPTRPWQTLLAFVLVAVMYANTPIARADSKSALLPYGLASRIAPKAYLNMPHQADGKVPLLLSQTGAFSAARDLIVSKGIIPYDIVVAFWSDGANKLRWVSVPDEQINYSPTGEWTFPRGTVFIKTFELSTDAANPGVKRRLETRLLVCDSAGGVYGVVYKWRPDNSDADLLSTSRTEQIPIKTSTGEVRNQTWYFPSRPDCLTCHNAKTSGVLGVTTRQMNRTFAYPSGVTDNELRAWNHLGLFTPAVDDTALAKLPRLAAGDDESRSLQDRARSYLDVNCAQCHRPGGTVAYFDARYDTPLDQQGLVEGPVLIDQGIDRPRVVSPHDIWRSIALLRVNTLDDIKMPPIARETIDQKGAALLRNWITSLPGRSVLDPPAMSPLGGTFGAPIEVSLSEREPGATIRYTVDGSLPGPSDTRYEKPIKITDPTVLRARAYKDGFTRSITVQDVFIIGK